MASSTRFWRWSLLFLFSANFAPQIAAFTQCYYPDGSVPVDYLWVPCIGTGHSSCCIPSEGDICQDNGLCLYPPYNNTFRGTCTDRTWDDPACPKNICVAGNEDTWAWSSPCSSNDKDVTHACGHVEDGVKVSANCTAGATTHYDILRTVETTSTKPTRYTAPPPLDTSKFTVYTETYTTGVSAWIQTTTFTTTWQVTITSALGQVSGTATGAAPSITGTRGGFTGTGTAAPISTSAAPAGGITMSPGILGAAIGGPIVGIALIAFLFFFLRKKRAAKKANAGSLRLKSSPSAPPPANGPVGNDQVTPYEVPATEVSYTGAFVPDRKYVYNGTTEGRVNGAYEIGSAGEKGWGAYGHGVQEVSGNERQQYVNAQQTGVQSPRSPAPVYSEANGPAVMPVELDGGSWQRPVGSNRNGVGNA